MYTRWLPLLEKKKMILASGSAQRKKILEDLGFKFEVLVSNFPEDLEKTDPSDYVTRTCKGKLDQFLTDNANLDVDLLVTSDCIIAHDGNIREKPKNDDEIREWLKQYSNNDVLCYTSVAVALIVKEDGINKIKNFDQTTVMTTVTFQELNNDIIEDYIKTGEPYNKAGAFGIQGFAKTLIKKIDGCFYNVVGFPVQVFCQMLTNMLQAEYGSI